MQIFRDEPRLLAMLSEWQPQLIDQTHCVLSVANPWQMKEFRKYGKTAMDYVRKQLHAPNLQLTLQLAPYDTSNRAYTDEERYALLLKNYPVIRYLKEKLNLQIE